MMFIFGDAIIIINLSARNVLSVYTLHKYVEMHACPARAGSTGN